MKGGRYKAMFKLKESILEADELAQEEPNRYEVGKFGWVTARFMVEKPMPKNLWEQWLDESCELSVATGTRKKTLRKRQLENLLENILCFWQGLALSFKPLQDYHP